MIKVPLSCGAPIRERKGGGRRIGNYTEESKNCFLEDFFLLACVCGQWEEEGEGIILIKINCGRMPPREQGQNSISSVLFLC